MTTPFPATVVAALLFITAVCHSLPAAHALGGSSATLAVVYGSAITICTVAAEQPVQRIQCWRDGQSLSPILPETSFDFVAGGHDVLCGVRSGGFRLLCWDSNFRQKRIYNDTSVPLISLSVGGSQICALRNASASNAVCWRDGNASATARIPARNARFRAVSSGLGLSCGVLEDARVSCWGDDGIPDSIQSQFADSAMTSIQVGGGFACGINTVGIVICRGINGSGQLNLPSNKAYEYLGLALGANHGCAVRRMNRTVVCWGGNGEYSNNITDGIGFESIVAGLNFTCGLTTSNFSVICWGPGWPEQYHAPGVDLPLQKSLPGPCVDTACLCNVYPQSQILCYGNGHICWSCDVVPSPIPSPPPLISFLNPSPSRALRRGLFAFAIIGSVGGLGGICTVIYCLWTGVCFGKKKIHNSVQPTITSLYPAQVSNGSPLSRSSTLRRQGSMLMRRQRSGTSSKHADRAEVFLFSDLAMATNDFAAENRIGTGSFGVVYKGKLANGREVAIKRSEAGPKARKFQDKESAFESELAFLSRLHHKHLVSLVGYCEEQDERLLVYEYMKNGAVYDHLHNPNKGSSVVNSWKMRIKIALDASRGIEYLHNYAVPPIIHRDIKSSNILLDANWSARVSDFGLSLMGPEEDYQATNAAGTVGYIDPEYYGLNVLTAKSDVYGLGVVLLELLTGRRAIFKSSEGGSEPMSVVDYAVPAIMGGEVCRILDPRVEEAQRRGKEWEAVELVAYTAMHCVHLEGKDRPCITDVVANLERALGLCEDSHGSISSDPNSSIVSE